MMSAILPIVVVGVVGLFFLFHWRNIRVDRAYRRLLRFEPDMAKLKSLVGKSGICRSACRPQGRVEVDGVEYNAKAKALIALGGRVMVIDFEVRTMSSGLAGPLLTVRQLDAGS